MKLIALAAMLALGGTATAQDMPQPQTGTTTTTTQQTAPADSAMSTTDQSTNPGTTGAGTAAPDASMEDPKGGYMPSTPALSGTPMPGQAVQVMPSRSATEAFPPPAPLKSYPPCKKNQYDNCRQRGGR